MDRRRFITTTGLVATGTIVSGKASAEEDYPGLDDDDIDDDQNISLHATEFYGDFSYSDEECISVHATFPENRVDDKDVYLDELDHFFDHLVDESDIQGIRLRTYNLSGDPGWDDTWDDARWTNRKKSNRLVARYADTYGRAGAFVWFDETMDESYAWPRQAWERRFGLAPYEDIWLSGSSGYLSNIEDKSDEMNGDEGTFAHAYVADRQHSPTTAAHEVAHLITNNYESEFFADDAGDADHELGDAFDDDTYSILGQRSGNGVDSGTCSNDSVPDTRISETSTCTEFVIRRSIDYHVRNLSDLENGEFRDLTPDSMTLGKDSIVVCD